MTNIKQSVYNGKFYPKDSIELDNYFNLIRKDLAKVYDCDTRLIVVPHAGYFYSGEAAAKTYQYLKNDIKNVFIISPSHYVDVEGLCVPTHDAFSTPLGISKVNKEYCKELSKTDGINYNDTAFEKEHAIEVQIPFIQKFAPEAKIIPIVCNRSETGIIRNIIERFYTNTENVFVISSDLSHFYPLNEAEKIDTYTANMIENQEIKNFHPAQACGAQGIIGAVEFAKEKDFALIRTVLTTSAAKTNDTTSVVGYGGWILVEDSKNRFLKKNFSELIINTALNSIKSGLNSGVLPQIRPNDYPPVFMEQGACFVTLETFSQLRGCIGSVIAKRAFIEDLTTNAFNAAFEDPRFVPLSSDELENLKISVSLLSSPKEIFFDSEEDLLNKITPYKDGLIIKDNLYQAVYLPSVWQQLPDKREFLNSLKMKAGLDKNHFSKTFKAYNFTTEYIQEI